MNLYRRLIWWYLSLPVFIFLLSWNSHIIGMPLFCGLLFAVEHVAQFSDIKKNSQINNQFNVGLIVLTVILAVLVTWLTIVGNFSDWWKHRAIFFDLSRCEWPVNYEFNAIRHQLSFYLMYYIPPAIIAKVIGLQWLSLAVIIWTMIGYGLIFFGYFYRSRTIIEWFILLFLLVSFGGWDVLGWLWITGHWPPFGQHLATWNVFQSSSNISVFYWVPQHVIPAWLSGVLLFHPSLQSHEKVRFGSLLVVLVAYWSPLVAIGLVFFIILDIFSLVGIRAMLNSSIIYFFSICLIIPYYLYLSRDASLLNSGWSWRSGIDFQSYYLEFIFFTIAVLFVIVMVLVGRRVNYQYLMLTLALLLLAPFYRLGVFFDLTMRGPLVAYVYLSMAAGDGALNLLRSCGTADRKGKQGMGRLTLAILLLIPSGVTGLYDSIPGINALRYHSTFPEYTDGVRTSIESSGYQYQYVVPATPIKNKILLDSDVCP